MSDPLRVLIADDHTIVRSGIKLLLEADPDIDVVGESLDGEQAVAMIESLQPDVVLMDIAIPGMDGLEEERDKMLSLPGWMITRLGAFAPVIYEVSTWYKVEILVVGAIQATGKRTVCQVLRVMGLGSEPKYAQYHHVLRRAVWSGLEASEVLLRMVLKTFGTEEKVFIFGIDEPMEKRLKPKGFSVIRCGQADYSALSDDR